MGPDRENAALPKLATLDAELSRLGIELDEVARTRFARYLALLGEWEGRAGLTAVTDPEDVQRRHFGESLALLVALRDAGLLAASEAREVADLGAGAGFPGLPMLIADSALRLTLIESNRRRCAFLEEAVAALELNGVAVVAMRAEEAGRDPTLRGAFDLVVARAVAPLAVLVEYALPLLREGGALAAPKGSRASEELRDAEAAIAELGGRASEPLPLSLPASAPPQQVLVVQRVGEVPERYPRRPGIPAKRPLR